MPDSLISMLLLIGVSLFAYLFPSFLAHTKSHHNTPAIFALNILLGWTLIGWVAALVWALTRPPKA